MPLNLSRVNLDWLTQIESILLSRSPSLMNPRLSHGRYPSFWKSKGFRVVSTTMPSLQHEPSFYSVFLVFILNNTIDSQVQDKINYDKHNSFNEMNKKLALFSGSIWLVYKNHNPHTLIYYSEVMLRRTAHKFSRLTVFQNYQGRKDKFLLSYTEFHGRERPWEIYF